MTKAEKVREKIVFERNICNRLWNLKLKASKKCPEFFNDYLKLFFDKYSDLGKPNNKNPHYNRLKRCFSHASLFGSEIAIKYDYLGNLEVLLEEQINQK